MSSNKSLFRFSLRCPVCDSFKFDEIGKYEICPVCKWEDDPIQRKDPDYEGGANGMSLNAYRLKYLESKAESDSDTQSGGDEK